MPYKFVETGPPKTTLIDSFESFLIRVDFQIPPSGKLKCVGRSSVALFQSRTSRSIRLGAVDVDPLGQDRQFSLSDLDGAGTLGLQLGCREERTLDLHNEIARLSILESPPMVDGAIPTWVTPGGWTQILPTLGPNLDGTPDRRRAISLGNVNNRQAYAVTETTGTQGTASLQVVAPFLSNPIIAEILGMHGKQVNKQPFQLSASWNGKSVGSWTYPLDSQPPIPGFVYGTVLVVQGIFKECLLGELAAWGPQKAPRDWGSLAQPLWELALRRNRTLESVDQTEENTIVRPSPDPPVEVLILNSLSYKAKKSIGTLY
ncbi:MAG: hypothetical protein AAGM22_26790 [Acidobacteriota bacterium]